VDRRAPALAVHRRARAYNTAHRLAEAPALGNRVHATHRTRRANPARLVADMAPRRCPPTRCRRCGRAAHRRHDARGRTAGLLALRPAAPAHVLCRARARPYPRDRGQSARDRAARRLPSARRQRALSRHRRPRCVPRARPHVILRRLDCQRLRLGRPARIAGFATLRRRRLRAAAARRPHGGQPALRAYGLRDPGRTRPPQLRRPILVVVDRECSKSIVFAYKARRSRSSVPAWSGHPRVCREPGQQLLAAFALVASAWKEQYA
jgi:hypothetical protein